MSWDRRHQREYYSRSYRVDGRIVREYVGGGAAGEQAAAEDARRRAQRQAAAAAQRAEQDRWDEATRTLRDLCDLSDLLVRAALLAAGFHQHARGAWRRKRHVHDHEPNDTPRPPNL